MRSLRLQQANLQNSQEQNLIEYVDEHRACRQILIEDKSMRLAQKLGTKWFNKGEKSLRYFMLLRNRSLPDNFELLQDEAGVIVTAP